MVGRFICMGTLKSWKAAELRQLASQFRRQATATRQPKYVELLCHTAEDLEAEADVLEHLPPASERAHIDIYV